MDLRNTSILLPHIPESADLSRLKVAKSGIYGLELQVLLHDLLPLTHPQFFPEERVSSHVHLLQLLGKTDIIHVGSETLANQLSGWFQFRACRDSNAEIRVGSFPSMVPEPCGKENRAAKERLVFIGGFQDRKGLRDLAHAVETGQLTGYEFDVVGGVNPFRDDEVSLLRRVATFTAFHLKGQVMDSDLANMLSEASVVLYLSAAEGFGLPVVEAARFGCSVVAADTPINHELSRRFGNLFLIPLSGEQIDFNQIGPTLKKAISNADKPRPQNPSKDESPRAWAAKVLNSPDRSIA